MSDLKDLVASEVLQVGCPRKPSLAWRFACKKCSLDQHPGAEKEAGLGRRRSMIGCDAISTMSLMGSTGAKMAVRSFQNWNEGDGLLYYAS